MNTFFFAQAVLLPAPRLAAQEKGPLSSVSWQHRAGCGIHGAASSASEACNAVRTLGPNLG